MKTSTATGRVALGAWVSIVALVPAEGRAAEKTSAGESASVERARVEVSCVTQACHATLKRGRYVHGPVSRNACASCHEPRTKVLPEPPDGECVAVWGLTRSPAKLCGTCHPLTLRNYVHEPVGRGECTSCHDPHASEHPHLLVREPARELCFECHEKEEYRGKTFQHEPASSGACILCHEPHSSWEPRLLVKGGARLCSSCHAGIESELAQHRYVHDPVLEDCSSCHDPHGSETAAQLRAPSPELCTGCHAKIEELVATSANVHGAVRDGEGCLNCHAGHGSELPRLLRRPLLDSCLGCHDRPVRSDDGQMLADMARLLRDNPDHHGPVRRANCSSCHDPHASPNFRRLRGRYPEDFYVAGFDIESYSLCFQCHLKEMLLVERGPGITRFQHGDVNLHYKHVTREKSRSCRACHATHASKNPAHLVDTFTYGEWKDAPLGYEKLPGGGRCAPACHRAVAYERGSKEPVPVVK